MFDYASAIIVLPERLGDTLFHTPSLRLLKEKRPTLKIGIIALSPLCADVLKKNPYVDNLYLLPDQAETRRIAAGYEVAMNVHNHAHSRQYVDWLGLPTLAAPPNEKSVHTTQNALDFICSLLQCDISAVDKRYGLYPGADNTQKIADALQKAGATSQHILIGCHIGCHSIAKRGWKFWKPQVHPKVWSLQNFIALDAALRKHDPRFRMVLTGSKAEKNLGDKFIRKSPQSINLIDATSVTDLAALMQRLTLFVTPDTGTLHVACSSDVGIIALFGPTSLQLTGPYPMRDDYRVLQAENIDDIPVSQVFDAIVSHPAVRKTA
jgi:ADP-heptose:LPS heptosyltransferase